eukprot:2307501-Rhodomonas_salina.1
MLGSVMCKLRLTDSSSRLPLVLLWYGLAFALLWYGLPADAWLRSRSPRPSSRDCMMLSGTGDATGCQLCGGPDGASDGMASGSTCWSGRKAESGPMILAIVARRVDRKERSRLSCAVAWCTSSPASCIGVRSSR